MSEVKVNSSSTSSPSKPGRGLRFWLVFFSICVSLFLAALELTAVSTALPVIANELHATEFVWVGSAYALASTAFLPMSGGLAQIFGRRPAMLFSLGAFFLGSGICGGAKDMPMMIGGRVVQGMGGAGVQALSAIILSDMVPLSERGAYAGFFGLTWSVASLIGPVVGGTLASHGSWRWLFYLNLPIAGFAAILTLILLDLPTPSGTFKEKIGRIDWIGNFLVIGSTTACTIALTWGGITRPWNSPQVLAPLIIGLAGLVVFVIFERIVPSYPLVPFTLLSNRTSVSGHLQTFFIGVVALGVVYMFPVYFQACKNDSAVYSGVMGLGLSALAPAAIIAGVVVKKTGHYRPPMWFGWVLTLVGLGLFSTVTAESSRGKAVGYMIIMGVGIGCEYSTTMFPVQAPLSVSSNAHALAFMMFVRSFAGVWGVTIGSTVVQNELSHRLPQNFASQLSGSVSLAYSVIPRIPYLPENVQREVHEAFSGSLSVLWKVLVGIAGLGLLSSLLMKAIPLHKHLDEEWMMRNARTGGDDREKDLEIA